MGDRESVWDYPRPPRLEPTSEQVVVSLGGAEVARTTGAYRVLETSHPPSYYLPPGDVDASCLEPAGGGSICEWKGRARYWTVATPGGRAEQAAWSYPEPTPAFVPIAGYLAFYPRLLDCTVDGEAVEPQPGGFYGGWVTSRVVGPFKGAPGTLGW